MQWYIHSYDPSTQDAEAGLQSQIELVYIAPLKQAS